MPPTPPLRRLASPCPLALCLLPVLAAAAGPVAAEQKAEQIEVRGQREPTPVEPVQVLGGSALVRRVDSTLGATLQGELGTANASFGPNVGLPLIRGQGGPRVRAMQDGLGTHDASTVSADHGVMVEPAMAERITIWRGPATIRFGGAAIGGAVEVDEGRVPTLQRKRAEVRAIARAGTGASRVGVLRLDGPLHEHVAWHADVHGRSQRETPIPGWAIDEVAVRQQFQLVNSVNTHGRIDNTEAVTEGGALGLGWVAPRAHAGLAVSRLRQVYGIPPGGHSHQHAGAPGEPAAAGGDDVRIHARQQRVDLRAETPWSAGWLPAAVGAGTLRLKAVRSNYEHDEREGARTGTRFRNDVNELRLEIDHRLGARGEGTLGLQAQARRFSALGPEAFVPETRIRGAGVFALQRWSPLPWTLELGLRADLQRYAPLGGLDVLGQARSFPPRRFWPYSASFAVQRAYGAPAAPEAAPAPQGSLTLTHWRVGRAPDVQELYAAGPHLATRSFDFGNTALGLERLHAWDLAWQHRSGAWRWKAHAWAYDSRDFIYQRSLAWFYEMEEGMPQAVCARLDRCLPATKREQAAARFHGYEAELAREWRSGSTAWRVAAFSDLVRGRLTTLGQDVPRLPPQRHGLGAEAETGGWALHARWTRARAQLRPGENETPTAGWQRLDASLRREWLGDDGTVRGSWFVVARNLTNRTIRNSASFLRNYAPEPGRAVEVGLEATL